MIDRSHALPLTRQARALGISRGSVYYLPRSVSAADADPFLFEEVAQHPAARERELQMQLVNPAHDGEIGRGHRSGPVVDAAAADPECFGLPGERQRV